MNIDEIIKKVISPEQIYPKNFFEVEITWGNVDWICKPTSKSVDALVSAMDEVDKDISDALDQFYNRF